MCRYLAENNFRLTKATGGKQLRAVLNTELIDLVVLQQAAATHDGLALAREVFGSTDIPVVMLSERSEEADRVMALELGADDYMTKPFSPRELLAHVRAILRRCSKARRRQSHAARAYRFDGWQLDLYKRELTSPMNAVVALANGEFNLLAVLLGANDRVLTRAQLLQRSQHDATVFDRSVDAQICRLRRKLRDNAKRPRYIVSVRGAGYRIGVPVQTVW